MADEYRPFVDDDRTYTTVDASWRHLRSVQEIRMRSRVVSSDEKETVCTSYGWDAEETCSDELTFQATVEALAEALFRTDQEVQIDNLKPGVVLRAMRVFLSEAQGGGPNGDPDATALSQVLGALRGATTDAETAAP